MAGHLLCVESLWTERAVGDKKDPEFEDLGMDTLGENVYSHIPIFLLPQIVAHWNSPQKKQINYKATAISSCGPNKMEQGRMQRGMGHKPVCALW